jgi:two-component system, chemotaxis family, sensor kinase CheA
MMENAVDDLLQEFLTETNEGIALLDGEIVQLEKNPNNPALISSIFRLFHTIKGTCGFLALNRLEKIAHAAEDVLGKVRDGQLAVTSDVVSLILKSLDRIKYILATIESTEAEPEGNDHELIEILRSVAEGKVVSPSSSTPKKTKKDTLVKNKVSPKKQKQENSLSPVETNDEPQKNIAPLSEAGNMIASSSPDENEPKESSVSSQSIRVSVGVLENLMTLVSELVLTRNQLLQLARNSEGSERENLWTVPLQHLSHVTSELQEGVMKTRMQQIGSAWGKLPRIIRDLTLELKKKIELQMIGAETELDRQVLELIKDPLTHMVRNSADHGIESPAERLASGKSETGRILLNAYHESGHILIEIADDGKGLNIDRIKTKIIANNLASESEVQKMSEQQIYQYIFKAGFSTAANVTAVSGRGVGMDVVKTNIEKIGGTVSLKSIPLKGTTFTIKIPLTLAIISALIVSAGGEKFAIPQINIIELVSAGKTSEHKIEFLKNSYILRLRNRLLPLISLNKVLELEHETFNLEKDHFIVVVQIGSYSFGVIVDQVFDTEEIVVKPVSHLLRHISILSGSTILGDGSIIMILDPNGLASATGDYHTQEEHSKSDFAVEQETSQLDEKASFLIFTAGQGNSFKAVPLSLVTRIEKLPTSHIELGDTGRPVIQYRGKLMPLVTLDEDQNILLSEIPTQQPVLVFSDEGRDIGLKVNEIVDICQEKLDIEYEDRRPGHIGRAIISERATDLLDIGYVLSKVSKEWFHSENQSLIKKKKMDKKILFIDDSSFFHNLLTPLLNVSGYHVTNVNSAEEALELCNQGLDFDVILSDLEMPNMNGFDFVTYVKKNTRWNNVPIVALSSHDMVDVEDQLKEVGFTNFIAKLDRDALLSTLQDITSHRENIS